MPQETEPSLTPYQRLLLKRLEKSFLLPVTKWINPESDLVTPNFESTFRTRLLYHHTVTDEVLIKKSFEYAFRDALRVDGIPAEINIDSTARGFDVIGNGIRYSLKTEAHKTISTRSIHISKLMECAWLRHVGDDRDLLIQRINEYVLPHFENYDRIFTLRIFREDGLQTITYMLVEIPKELFLQIRNLKAEDFSPINPLHNTSAKVTYKGQQAFTLRFDGSDEKVTLSAIRVNLCVTHARWVIPVLFTEVEEDLPGQLDLGIYRDE